MSVAVYQAKPPSLQGDVERLWIFRALLREGALDPLAAEGALRPLLTHANGRVRTLALDTQCDAADLAHDRAADGALAR